MPTMSTLTMLTMLAAFAAFAAFATLAVPEQGVDRSDLGHSLTLERHDNKGKKTANGSQPPYSAAQRAATGAVAQLDDVVGIARLFALLKPNERQRLPTREVSTNFCVNRGCVLTVPDPVCLRAH